MEGRGGEAQGSKKRWDFKEGGWNMLSGAIRNIFPNVKKPLQLAALSHEDDFQGSLLDVGEKFGQGGFWKKSLAGKEPLVSSVLQFTCPWKRKSTPEHALLHDANIKGIWSMTKPSRSLSERHQVVAFIHFLCAREPFV